MPALKHQSSSIIKPFSPHLEQNIKKICSDHGYIHLISEVISSLPAMLQVCKEKHLSGGSRILKGGGAILDTITMC